MLVAAFLAVSGLVFGWMVTGWWMNRTKPVPPQPLPQALVDAALVKALDIPPSPLRPPGGEGTLNATLSPITTLVDGLIMNIDDMTFGLSTQMLSLFGIQPEIPKPEDVVQIRSWGGDVIKTVQR